MPGASIMPVIANLLAGCGSRSALHASERGVIPVIARLRRDVQSLALRRAWRPRPCGEAELASLANRERWPSAAGCGRPKQDYKQTRKEHEPCGRTESR